MNYIQIAEDTNAGGVPDATLVFGSTPTSGNLIVLVCKSGGGAIFTLPSGFTSDVHDIVTSQRVQIASKVYAGEGNSFAVSRSHTTGDWRVTGFELPAGAAFDVSDTGGAVSAESSALGSVVTTIDDAIAITGIKFSNSVTGLAISDSFTLAFEDNARQEDASKALAASGSVDCTWSWTNSVNVGSALAVYGVPAAGGISMPAVAAYHRMMGYR